MELRIENNGNIRVINFGKVNLILGANKSGKTQKLEKLNEVFNGNSDYALINGVEVNNGLYNVVYLKENRDIEAEIQIKAKSAFHMNVVKPLVNNNYNQLKQFTEEFASNLSSILEEQHNIIYDYPLSNNEIAVNTKKLEKLETILFEIYSGDKHSMGSKEEFYFYQTLANLKEGINNIILIDDIDRYLDSNVILKFIEFIIKRKDTTIVMTSKNKYLLYELQLLKYIDKNFNVIDLLPIAKETMFDRYHKMEKSNLSLDNYIIQSENFYSETDYNSFMEEHFLEILKKIEM
ncbi:hypothetical protein R2F61_02460 [Mollicutes bacterium LVI A0078]|nr:hypothetical protein RZE84_02490 [Mollicutes bacterium LVI A0075]WOO91432.1 hypothetical protein R2F61_02460 [Mollicutes bacterium LVI A0078]